MESSRSTSACSFLLLVSADFLASRRCYEAEMEPALGRHARGEARVIPVRRSRRGASCSMLSQVIQKHGELDEVSPYPAFEAFASPL